MTRARGVSSFTVLLAGILFALPAIGQGTPAPAPEYVDGQIQRLEGKLLVLADGQALLLTDEGLADITFKREHGQVKDRGWIRAYLDKHLAVTRVDPIDPPRDSYVDPGLAETVALLTSLKRGDHVLLGKQPDVTEETFDHFDARRGLVFFSIPDATGFDVRSLREIRSIKRTTGPSAAVRSDPAAGGPAARITPGYWYKVDGQYGYCTRANDEEVILELPAGTETKFRSRSIGVFSLEPDPERPRAPSATAAVIPGSSQADDAVQVFIDPVSIGALDWVRNRFAVAGRVRHSRAQALLVGARVEVRLRAMGALVSPEKKKEILENATELKDAVERGFMYQGTRHYFRRDGDKTIVAEVGQDVQDEQKQSLAPMFPGLDTPFSVSTTLLYPVPDRATRVVYGAQDFVPFGDERAIPHLERAYVDGDPPRRAAALDALVAGQNAKALPFLLYHCCIEPPGPLEDRLRDAIVAFHKLAEGYLIELVGPQGAKLEPPPSFVVSGGPAPPSRDQIIGRAIELLEALGSERARPIVLPHAGSPNELVRQSATSFFVSAGKGGGGTADVASWLVKRLRGQGSAESAALLLELEKHNPGTLGRLLHEPPFTVSQDFERKTAGLTGSELARRELEYLVQQVKSGGFVDEEVQEARRSMAALSATETELEVSRRRLAVVRVRGGTVVTATAGQPDQEPRLHRLKLCEGALVLDPKNEAARHELARLSVTLAREMLDGAQLRTGPGEAYRSIRKLVKDEDLAIAAGDDPKALWRRVRASDGGRGYVHASLVRASSTSLHVRAEARSLDDVQHRLAVARALADAEVRAEIDGLLAQVAKGLGDRAASVGDWAVAYDRFQAAAALSRGKYRKELGIAYVHSNPLVAVIGVFSVVFLIALVVGGHGRIAPPQRPARTR